MHIELWQSPPRIADQRWHWNIVSKGRIVGDAESFPTKQHALRAAKGVIRGVIRKIHSVNFSPAPPRYELTSIGTQRFKLTWY